MYNYVDLIITFCFNFENLKFFKTNEIEFRLIKYAKTSV